LSEASRLYGRGKDGATVYEKIKREQRARDEKVRHRRNVWIPTPWWMKAEAIATFRGTSVSAVLRKGIDTLYDRHVAHEPQFPGIVDAEGNRLDPTEIPR